MFDKIRVPLWKAVAILIGFPIISYLLSLLLLRKSDFANLGLDFFTVFWILVSFWYIIQIVVTFKVLKSSNLTLDYIGYPFDLRKTINFIAIYLVFAFVLFGLVEFALASAEISAADLNSLSDFSNLTPKTTTHRIIFIFAGLFAGLAEEFVYRGFAIQTLEKYKVNKWLAIVIAAVPFVFQHGLKSLDQFWWFFIMGLVFGAVFVLTKRKLYIAIIIHWMIILSAMLAILQLLD